MVCVGVGGGFLCLPPLPFTILKACDALNNSTKSSESHTCVASFPGILGPTQSYYLPMSL